MDTPTPDFVTVATWATGHELARVTTDAFFSSLFTDGRQRRVQGSAPTFFLQWNGTLLYWLRIHRDELWSLGALSDEVFLDPVHRQVLVSAVIEVLQVGFGQIPRVGSWESYRAELLPVSVPSARLKRLLQAEEDLQPIVDELAAMHERREAEGYQQRYEQGVRFSEGIVGEQGDLRRRYQNESAGVIRRMQPWIGNLSRINNLMSAPGLWKDLAPRLDYTKTPIRSSNTQKHGNWWIVLALGLVPQPSWSVVLAPNKGAWSSEPDFSKPGFVLVDRQPGPVTALLEARLLVEKTPGALEDQLGQILAGLPDPHMEFDNEAYRLLDEKSPLLWKLEPFLEWVSEM